jgi:deoxyadenosine/deoxycytidine kinase
MTPAEASEYRRHYEDAVRGIRSPDLVVYLRRSVEGLLGQIARRGREFEAGVSREFLEAVNRRYERWFEAWPGPKLLIEGDAHDFVGRAGDLEKIEREVLRAIGR